MPALITAIPNLLVAFDEQLGDDFSQPALLLMFLDGDDNGELGLGVKPLAPGQHPLSELLGFVAPADCLAIGTICHGWATQRLCTRPSTASDRQRLRALHVICRDGGEVGGLHLEGGVLQLRADAIGTVPDALRRTLGLPTPPPEKPPPAGYLSWDAARWDVVTGKVELPDLDATGAAWMDDGMFARWVAGTAWANCQWRGGRA